MDAFGGTTAGAGGGTAIGITTGTGTGIGIYLGLLLGALYKLKLMLYLYLLLMYNVGYSNFTDKCFSIDYQKLPSISLLLTNLGEFWLFLCWPKI